MAQVPSGSLLPPPTVAPLKRTSSPLPGAVWPRSQIVWPEGQASAFSSRPPPSVALATESVSSSHRRAPSAPARRRVPVVRLGSPLPALVRTRTARCVGVIERSLAWRRCAMLERTPPPCRWVRPASGARRHASAPLGCGRVVGRPTGRWLAPRPAAGLSPRLASPPPPGCSPRPRLARHPAPAQVQGLSRTVRPRLRQPLTYSSSADCRQLFQKSACIAVQDRAWWSPRGPPSVKLPPVKRLSS